MQKRFLILFITLYSLFFIHAIATTVPEDLKQALNEKTQALQEINQKILETQKDLEETENKSKTLQQEIGRFDNNINQLNLSIQGGKIKIDKLNLEIEVLQYDINDTEDQINIKKEAVARLLRELQQKDNETVLMVLLKHRSLAASLAEAQNILDINAGLSAEVTNLQSLNDDLADKLTDSSDKKWNMELENKNLVNRKVIVQNQKSDKQSLLTQTKNQEKEYQSLISDLEKQQEAIAEEIEKTEAELRKTIDPSLLPTPRPGVLAHPLPGSRLTQDYGKTKFAIYGYRGQWHNGLDFGAPIGTPIFAADKGRVLEVWDQDKYCYRGAYGKFIVIEHENNLVTLYAHLSRAVVEKGDYIETDQLIGYVGNTGYSTGPHLHFGVYAGPTFRIGPSKLNCGPIMPYGGDLDPKQYLRL